MFPIFFDLFVDGWRCWIWRRAACGCIPGDFSVVYWHSCSFVVAFLLVGVVKSHAAACTVVLLCSRPRPDGPRPLNIRRWRACRSEKFCVCCSRESVLACVPSCLARSSLPRFLRRDRATVSSSVARRRMLQGPAGLPWSVFSRLSVPEQISSSFLCGNAAVIASHVWLANSWGDVIWRRGAGGGVSSPTAGACSRSSSSPSASAARSPGHPALSCSSSSPSASAARSPGRRARSRSSSSPSASAAGVLGVALAPTVLLSVRGRGPES